MKWSGKKFFLTAASALLLFGCKANLVEIPIRTNDLNMAIEGVEVAVEFAAKFSLLSKYDDKTKAQIASLKEIVDNYIPIEEFDITVATFGVEISIEGAVPLVYSPDGTAPRSIDSPWALVVSDNRDGGSLSNYPYKLTVLATPRFPAFEGELKKLNFLLSPSEFQPMKFKVKTSGDDKLTILTGAVEVQGEAHVIYEAEVSKRITLTMKEGIYDRTSQVIYFSLQ